MQSNLLWQNITTDMAVTLQPFDLTNVHYPIIEHINEEHSNDLLDMARSLLNINNCQSLQTVSLNQIYQQGLGLQLNSENNHLTNYFLAFSQPVNHLDELHQQYTQLLQQAHQQLGKKTIEIQQQTFLFQQGYFITDNIYRLLLQAPANTPMDEAGYSYLFYINQANESPIVRYYTLRKAWKNVDNTILAWVDIFIHDNNAGGNWAKSLQQGDSVVSKKQFPEHLSHLNHGQMLLIADETSLPTIARLLELWQNPIAPIVIIITQHSAEQNYLIKIDNNPYLTFSPPIIHSITANQNKIVIEQISMIIKHYQTQGIVFQGGWGALEASLIKPLRQQLLQQLSLNRNELPLKVYWRKT